MNLQSFKLLKEDDDAYHVKHPGGKTLRVVKGGLSEKAHSLIKKMPKEDAPQKFADGDEVQANPSMSMGSGLSQEQIDAFNASDPNAPQAGQSSPSDETPAEAPPAGAGALSGVAAGVNDQPADVADTAAAAGAPIDPITQNGISQDAIINKEEKAIQDYMNAETTAGAAQQGAWKDFADKQAKLLTPNDIAAKYKDKDQQLFQAIMDNHIDPNRYMNEKSTGSKILAGIGIALSGMGSATTGQSNLALDQINGAIKNDIAAQQNEQSKRMNLWKMNREAMGSDIEANLQTQNQFMTATQAKIAQATATTSSAGAKLRGQQLIAQLETQKNANHLKLGIMGGAANGTADPVQLVPLMVPAEHQKQALTELGQSQAATQNESQLMALYDQAVKENSLAGRAGRLGFVPPSIKGLNALSDPLIHDNEGRINELEQQHVQALWPGPLQRAGTDAANRVSFHNFIQHKKIAPTAKAFGIDPTRFQSTSGGASQPVIKTMGGVPYMQVQGGWKRVQ